MFLATSVFLDFRFFLCPFPTMLASYSPLSPRSPFPSPPLPSPCSFRCAAWRLDLIPQTRYLLWAQYRQTGVAFHELTNFFGPCRGVGRRLELLFIESLTFLCLVRAQTGNPSVFHKLNNFCGFSRGLGWRLELVFINSLFSLGQ